MFHYASFLSSFPLVKSSFFLARFLQHYCTMSEMLANNYFIVRNYVKAREVFLRLPESVRNSDAVKKKLVLCEIFLGNPLSALDYLLPLVVQNPGFIFKTDLELEDCPCRDLICELEQRPGFSQEDDFCLLSISILWLYCSLENSLHYLEMLTSLNEHPKVNELKFQIQKHINHNLMINSTE